MNSTPTDVLVALALGFTSIPDLNAGRYPIPLWHFLFRVGPVPLPSTANPLNPPTLGSEISDADPACRFPLAFAVATTGGLTVGCGLKTAIHERTSEYVYGVDTDPDSTISRFIPVLRLLLSSLPRTSSVVETSTLLRCHRSTRLLPPWLCVDYGRALGSLLMSGRGSKHSPSAMNYFAACFTTSRS
jgi:hypothetical protein